MQISVTTSMMRNINGKEESGSGFVTRNNMRMVR